MIADEVRKYMEHEHAKPQQSEWPRTMAKQVAEMGHPEPAPSLPLVHHIYTAEAFGGHVLPRKPYTLPLPAGATKATAAHVAIVAGAHGACAVTPCLSAIRGGMLHLSFGGEGVAAGISVLFVMPG